MAFTVLHMDKFKKDAVRGIQSHNQRERKSHSNPDIDYERSKLNYDLHNQAPIKFLSHIESRIDELDLKKTPRHDAVYMCGWIVSGSPEFFTALSADETRRFFETSYNYLAEQVGPDNVISAAVHMDEKTPHMHFTHVPITDDGRLNANAIYTRQTLQQMQSAFPQFLRESGFAIERGVEQVPGAAKVHLNTREYKQQTEAMKQTSEELDKLNHELVEVADKLADSRDDEKRLSERLAKYEDIARVAEDALNDHADSLPAPKMLNAKEIYAEALKIINLQKTALANKQLVEVRLVNMLEEHKKLAVKQARLEADNQELKSGQSDFDSAVRTATRQAERNVMRADRKAEKLTQELQATQKALTRLEAFVRKPEVRALYDRFESARTREKSREDFSR